MDDADLCLHKGSTSVLTSEALIARRKRMEIRRFKKLSKSTPIHDDLFPIAESSVICIKRARIERAATLGSLLETVEVSGTLTSAWHTEKTFSNRFGKGMAAAADLIDFGLLRYKSLPLGNILCDHVNDATMNSGGLGVHVYMNEGKLHNPLSVLCKDPKVEEDSPMEDVCSTSCRGSSSMSIGPETTKSDNIDALAVSNVSVVLGGGIATSEPTISRLSAEIDDNEVCAPKALPCIQSIDHTSVEHPRRRTCPPCGKLLVCGRRREMEDMSTIAPSFAQVNCGEPGSCFCPGKFGDQTSCDLHFFAVYDGHGGSQASTYCKERLHHALAEELSSLCSANEGDRDGSEGASSSSWEKAMETCFSKVDKEVGGVCPNGQCDVLCDGNLNCCGDSIAPENVGTTAVVAVVGSCQIVVANCGDSRAVLSRGGVAIPLSKDHKPERADETSRIEAAGGRVIYWDGYRVGGLLALSRSIGDRYLKQFVVSEPEVTRLQRMDDDECLILASDGLWDVINNDTACEIARKCLDSSRKKRVSGRVPVVGADPAAATAAALLVKLAYGRGSKDNISVVVIDLKS